MSMNNIIKPHYAHVWVGLQDLNCPEKAWPRVVAVLNCPEKAWPRVVVCPHIISKNVAMGISRCSKTPLMMDATCTFIAYRGAEL